MLTELEKIYRLWEREMKRFFREKSRLLTSIVTPLLWILVFGSGLRGAAYGSGGADYRVFIFPGILGMSLLFTSMFTGVSVIWEREFGFLREVLVAPVSRVGIITAKALGGASTAMIQGVILLCFAPLVKMHLTVGGVAAALPVMFLMSFGVTCIGLTIAAFMESMEGFNLIMSFAIMPMLFCSGALFPLDTAPHWLRIVSYFDPLTYGVDALRRILLGSGQSFLPLALNLGFMAVFAAGMTAVASACFAWNRK